MHAIRAVSAVLAAGLALPSLALAAPGDHVRTGDAVITPKIALGMEYSNNVYHEKPGSELDGAANLRVAPGLEAHVAGEELAFRFFGEMELRKYLDPEIRGMDRYNDFQVGAELKAFEQRTLGFEIYENAGMRNFPAESGMSAHAYEAQFRNQLVGRTVVRPGDDFEMRFGGIWTYDQFRVPWNVLPGGRTLLNDKQAYGPTVGFGYKIFPRTALVVEGSWEQNDWTHNLQDVTEGGQAESEVGTDLAIPDSQHFKGMAGVRGVLSEKLHATALVGYGIGDYDDSQIGDNPDAATDVAGGDRILADVQLRFEPGSDDRFLLGYERNFRDAFFTSFVAYDRPYARMETWFAERYGLMGEIAARFEDYKGEVGGTYEDTELRRDLLMTARADATYFVRDWASLTAGMGWQNRDSTDEAVDFDDLSVHVFTNLSY